MSALRWMQSRVKWLAYDATQMRDYTRALQRAVIVGDVDVARAQAALADAKSGLEDALRVVNAATTVLAERSQAT